MKKIKILAVDDELTFLETLRKVLKGYEYSVDGLSVSTEVIERINKQYYDAVLLDVNMPGISGIDILKQITLINPHLPVIIISGQSTIKIAVEAMKLGAYDFIEKPIDSIRLNSIIKNAVANKQLRDTTDRLISEIVSNYRMVGESEQLKKVCLDIDTYADSNAKVLITGETGTGKELVASAIHYRSERKDKPFIKINCASIPSELLESELFGYVKGAFTGAVLSKIGKFEAADGGTIFLDEIGEMEPRLQAKLLRVLEENEIEIIGLTETKKLDVRVITATNKELSIKVKEGAFRGDLFYRLNTFRIHIPPLRERKEDIIPIAYHFIEKYNNEYHKKVKTITSQAASLLLNNKWEGNVRELRNVIENSILFAKDDKLDINIVSAALSRGGLNTGNYNNGFKKLNEAREEFEKEYLQSALINNNGKINETAEALGIDRTNLFKKLQKHGIK